MNKRWEEGKSVHKIGYQLLKIVHQIDHNLLPASLLQAVLEAAMPFVGIIMSATVIDQLLSGNYKKALWSALIMVVATFTVSVLVSLLQQKTQVSKSMLLEQLQILISKQMLKLDFETMQNPDLQKSIENSEKMMQYNGGLSKLVTCYESMLSHIISIVVALVLVIELVLATGKGMIGWMKIATNPIITMAAIFGIWLLVILINRKKANQIKELNNHIQDTHYIVEGQLVYWLYHVLMNVEVGKTVRLSNMKDALYNHVEKWSKESFKLFTSMGLVERKQAITEGVVNGSFSMVAYLVVLLKVLAKCISIGSFTKYSGALMQFNLATGKVAWMETEISRLGRNLKPFLEFLDMKNDMETGSIHVEKRQDHLFDIEFHEVSFRYPGTTEDILKKVNCKITQKNKIAIVGRNGAGKTTFIKLLCRLYEPTGGLITLNGIDIRKYKYEEYLDLFGVVFQDFHIFAASLAENIAIQKGCDEKKILQCLSQAGGVELVETLEQGLETILNKKIKEGTNLSGGQAQKVAIARALYKDAPFVILDEPTASLDPISEAEVYQKFDSMVEDKTSIYISHRMSSCRFCDEIIVFDEGTIRERGSHKQLLSNHNLYSELWDAQAQYYSLDKQAIG